jgi:hypothetical protein
LINKVFSWLVNNKSIAVVLINKLAILSCKIFNRVYHSTELDIFSFALTVVVCGNKIARHQHNLPTLKEYVLIEQDYVDGTVYRRPAENDQAWHHTHYFLGDEITFESIGLILNVAEIYQWVVSQDMTEWLERQQAE